MPFALPPILAQTVTLSAGDRAEVRAIAQGVDRHAEAEDRAFIGAQLPFRHGALRLTYSPSFTLTPLESTPRDFIVTHALIAGADVAPPLYESRRTTLTLRLGAVYTIANVRRELLGAPAPTSPVASPTPPDAGPPGAPAPTEPATPTPAGQQRATGLTTHVASARADLIAWHLLGRRSRLSDRLGYSATSGIDRPSREVSPLAHGPEAGAAHTYDLTKRDSVTTSVESRLTFVPAADSTAFLIGGSENYEHRFSRRTTGSLNAGVTYTEVDTPEGVDVGIFPTGRGTLRHEAPFRRWHLTLSLEAAYAPVLETSRPAAGGPTNPVFDPRVGVVGNAGLVRDRFSLRASVAGAFSTNPHAEGSLTSVGATVTAAYELGSGFVVDTGLRVARQQFEDQRAVPLAGAVFIGLAWNADLL